MAEPGCPQHTSDCLTVSINPSKSRTLKARVLCTVGLLLLAALASRMITAPEATIERMPLSDFPSHLGEWRVLAEQRIDALSMEILQVDDYIMRTYVNPKGQAIQLYIGYFSSQREGKGIHSPRQCLPGAGWVPLEAGDYLLSLAGHNPGAVKVNRYLMGKGTQRQLYLFWYHGRGRAYASEYLNKLYLIWDGLTRRRTDGALIRLNMAATGDGAKALQTQQSFVNLFVPLLDQYVPR